MTEQQDGKRPSAMERWVGPGAVIVGCLLAGSLLLRGDDPRVQSVLALVTGIVGTLSVGALGVWMWRSGPAPARSRATHAVLAGMVLLLAIIGILLTLAALGTVIGPR
jgi:4-amino-4-deoxy-L-arabinose transferase-like glycosyltransferase